MARKQLKARQRANTTGDTALQPMFDETNSIQNDEQFPTGPKRSNTVDAYRDQQREQWNPPPAFDFQLSSAPEPPPSPPVPANSASEDGTIMIGVALGSPTTYRPGQPSLFPVISSTAPSEVISTDVADEEPQQLKRKPSKWKKIGSLFKSKNSGPQQEQPFYKLRVDDCPTTSHGPRGSLEDLHINQSHEIACRQGTLDDPDLKRHKTREEPKSEKENSKSPKLKEFKKLVKNTRSPKPSKRASREDGTLGRPSTPTGNHTPKLSESPDVPAPLISVDIPDVHMERYSVMFGNLLGKTPSTSLLARRSRTLEKLKTNDEEEFEGDRLPLPRRATSPGPTKSPSFTLFPATPTSKPSKGLYNPNFPRPNMPLQRSNTAPISPRRELTDLSGPTKDANLLHAETPSLATSSSFRSQWASRGSSFLSSASTSSSVSNTSVILNEDEMKLFDVKEVPFQSPGEPTWEILNPGARVEPLPVKSKMPRTKPHKVRSEEVLSATRAKSQSPSRKRKEVSIPIGQQEPIERKYKNTEIPLEPTLLFETGVKPQTLPENMPDSQPGFKVTPEAQHLVFHPTPDQWMPPPRPPPPPQRKPPPAPSASPPAPPQPTIVTTSPQFPRKEDSKMKFRSPPRATNPNLDADNSDINNPLSAHNAADKTNIVEVSVARSISVTKRQKQMIVPISAMRSDSLRNAAERFGEKRMGTPTLITVPRGHEREKSWDVPIEIA
ncbi:hypothetical protein AJ79_08786 [Helicocarpus griseus UAMH5409]|uniref:Uncharacterized protein n=1 Tax=Helicocarpus griseus UAMH5409 TaxID=1447875 RepID=A0A2B7WQC4_9EURO|nr:hypothetical protein AJ79_08786 [Helicocarpus griseus UAMH5409]